MKYKLDNKTLQYFKDRCEYWKHLLCVQYGVSYAWTKNNTVEASVSYDTSSRTATIYLARKWELKPTNKDLDIAALHEICHLLLAPIFEICDRYYNKDYLINIEHSIVKGLENIIGRKI